jgi:hypothetical protein
MSVIPKYLASARKYYNKPLLLVFLTTAFQPASADQASWDLAFQTNNSQSMWGAGSSVGFLNSIPIVGTSWNASGNLIDAITHVTTPSTEVCFIWCFTIPGLDLGYYGAKVDAGISGNVGLTATFGVSAGQVDVNYPIHATLDIPDATSLKGGQTVTIGSSYSVEPGASLQTFVGVDAGLYMDFGIDAWARGQACGVSCTGFDWTLINYHPDQIPLVTLNLLGNSVSLGNFQFSGHAPSITTASSVGGSFLQSSGEDPFLSFDANITGIIPGTQFSGEVAGFKLDAALLELLLGPALDLTQEFSFTAIPKVLLKASYSDGLIDNFIMPLGDSIDIALPLSGNVTVDPYFFLDNTLLSNLTQLVIDAHFNVTALSADISFSGTNLASLGPLVDEDLFRIPVGGITVFSDQWELGGFSNIAGNRMFVFQVVSEPDSILLLSAGLILLTRLNPARKHAKRTQGRRLG